MSYLSSKKIYPGNWTNALNGWYKNIDTNDDGTNNASKAGPTSVLAVPGWKYFQQRGYVAVTWASGDAATYGQTMDVIVPSPYRQDDTRPDITGMVISGSATQPAYVYRAAMSVASGWGDNRAATGIYAATGNVVTFCRNDSGPVAVTGVGEPIAQSNLTSTVSGDASTKIFFAAGAQALSSTPFLTATGATGVGPSGVYKEITGATTFKVFARGTNTATGVSGGVYLASADVNAGLKGYIVVEVCYIQPDEAPGYEDIDAYLNNRVVS
jgi:hypothetical protein